MKPKKLIREKITSKLKEGEFENITDLSELNKLYAIKVREELAEIQDSEHKDIMEFVDLIQVAVCFAEQNGFSQEQIELFANIKYVEKGKFSNLVLNNLNPENPSNKLYFEKTKNEFHPMWKKPEPSGDEDGYSKTVIVYELDHDTKKVVDSDLGFYNFETEKWNVLGDFSMNLWCWTEIPNPTNFMQDKDWVVELHEGFQP